MRLGQAAVVVFPVGVGIIHPAHEMAPPSGLDAHNRSTAHLMPVPHEARQMPLDEAREQLGALLVRLQACEFQICTLAARIFDDDGCVDIIYEDKKWGPGIKNSK